MTHQSTADVRPATLSMTEPLRTPIKKRRRQAPDDKAEADVNTDVNASDRYGPTFINCPFAEKDEAKALGARWDPTAKRWFVAAGHDLSPFRRWVPRSRTYLDVPFHQKDAAKALGARWNPERKKWWVEKLPDELDPFRPWLPCAARFGHLLATKRPHAAPRSAAAAASFEGFSPQLFFMLAAASSFEEISPASHLEQQQQQRRRRDRDHPSSRAAASLESTGRTTSIEVVKQLTPDQRIQRNLLAAEARGDIIEL